ncbi:hypothetical protein [Polaribacter sp. R77954]|uniref:hypothetical protein n=1 Tax=Polaribacter sp. R77954 TaxID=3093870 RepID=UPI0037C903E7
MNKKLTFFCVSSFVLGLLIYGLQSFNIYLPKIINNYVNDFLIIPIVLFLCLLFLKWSRNDKNFALSLPIILYVCFMYSILFEFVFPEYLARYTKDYMDIILYFAGGFLFYKLQNKPN